MSNRSVVGLEIAEGWVRGVELVKPASRRPVVRAVGEIALPEGAARDSEVLDADAVSIALRELWSHAGFKTKHVILGVGNRRILVRDFVAPNLPLDQIKRALPFQVQDLLPVPVEQAVLDFYPVEPGRTADGSEGVAGLLISAVSDNIQGLLGAVNSAGFRAVGIDLAPFGLARSAARVVEPGVRALVAHIGAVTSWFVVIEDQVPRFVRIVGAGVPAQREHSGSHRAEEQPAPVAETVPASPFPGFAPQPVVDNGAAEAVVDPIEDLLTWYSSTRDFYARSHPDQPVQQVLITGEGALDPEVAERLQAVTDVEVRTFGLNDAFAGADVDPAQNLGVLNAAGVAIGGEL